MLIIDKEKYYTVKEVSQMVGLGKDSIFLRIKTGDLIGFKDVLFRPNGRYLISEKELRRFMKKMIPTLDCAKIGD